MNKKEKIVKMLDGKHIQHSKKFNTEINSVKNNFIQPFRYYDEVWIVGKHIGKKLSDTPKNYIKWCYDNMKLTDTAKTILKNYI